MAVIDGWTIVEGARHASLEVSREREVALVMVDLDADWMRDAPVYVPELGADEWASEDILTPEVLAEFHRASEQLLSRRPD
jgi:hypothetical protein